jgi:hypothetical protein
VSFEDAPNTGGEGASDPEASHDAGGDIEQAAEQPDAGEPEPPRQYVEIDDPDNRYVRVKVDGEDVEVPFSEAVRGYSRTEDYTRKTQEAARLREEADYGLRLQQALQSNPEMTLQILAQQYGYSLPGQQAPQPEPEPEYSDPLEQALAEERNARLALEQRISTREADEALQGAITGLRGSYNASDEDIRDVVNTAYRMGVGIEALPMIYESMAFQKLNARVQAIRAQDAAKQAEEARRIAAKQQASQIINSGSSANGLTNQMDPNGRMSIREAIEAAFLQHEG